MPRLFAVIPAAGLSRRMGQPKLLLDLAGETVVARLLHALAAGPLEDIVAVIRRSDSALAAEIQRHGGTLVRPQVDPPDMRASVECALQDIQARHAPAPDDGWLLIPADHPVLDANLLQELCRRWAASDAEIFVPTLHGRRGHPTFFRWRLVDEVQRLPADRGLNELLRRKAAAVEEHPVDDDGILIDLDTPQDLARLRARWDRTEFP